MQDAIDVIRDRQRASASQPPPTLAELRAGSFPGIASIRYRTTCR